MSAAEREPGQRDPLTTTTPRAEYRIAADLSITLYLDGMPANRIGEGCAIRPLRKKDRAEQVRALLTAEMMRGATHGECDRQAEIAASLNGQRVPDHVEWRTWRDEGGTAVARRVDDDGGERWSRDGWETVLAGVKPGYLAVDICNELDRAFRVGGRYGAPQDEGQ